MAVVGIGAGVPSPEEVGINRSALKEVLSSKTFSRAQRLVKLLEYISERYFEGRAEEVGEYSIATEVLGRPGDFDPAQDAISRVEIHRLRKKLREYYATEGAHNPIKIVVPSGMYTPVFLRENPTQPDGPQNGSVLPDQPAAAFAEPPTVPTPAAHATLPVGRNWKLLTIVAASLCVAGGGAVMVAIWSPKTELAPPELPHPVPPPAAASTEGAIRIIAGYDHTKYVDRNGHTWLRDTFFEGGGNPRAPFRQFIGRTADPVLYQNGRIGPAGYNIPLKPGTYELKLHFVEPIYGPGLETGGGENSRVFDILANGKTLLENFDIVSDSGGPDIADVRIFKDIHPGPDGYLRLVFNPKRERPLISAIEIEPAQPGRMNPIRIVTQSNSVTDGEGRVWSADSYYLGGQASNHWKPVAGTADPELYSNERYGHFSYAIPVADGSYTVNLHFAEVYWGPDNLGGGGPGQRVFDVYCNGGVLLRNFDILKEAGSNRALVKKFHGLRPNAQGKLVLEFVPSANYASVFAIEVLDEAR
ncbi:MAG: malectin domain-containing carbohydrate-binding protein [Bryobacteraceae bacterium]